MAKTSGYVSKARAMQLQRIQVRLFTINSNINIYNNIKGR